MIDVNVRDADYKDLGEICGLYNALIQTETITWTEDLQTLQERTQWYEQQRLRLRPVLVAEVDAVVVGFASYGDFRGAGKWSGYRDTVEHTIHVARSHWGNGVGRALIEVLIARAILDGVHVMVGGIDSANTASLVFHNRLGFSEVGRMPEVGQKFGRWLDLVFMQLILSKE